MSETPSGNDAGGAERWQGYGRPEGPYQTQQPTPGQAPAGGYGPGPWNAPHQGDANRRPEKGFFGALFDLSFSNFVTLSFAKGIYLLAIVVAGLLWLLFVLGGFVSDSPGLGVAALLVGWVPALLYIVLVRVGLEFSVAMVRTAQNTSMLAQRR